MTKSIISILILIFASAVFLLGFYLGSPKKEQTNIEGEGAKEMWTCSMHLQIKLPKAGLCPICEMDLILVDQSNVGLRQLKLSEEAMALSEIQTTRLVRQEAALEIDMVGKVKVDPTRMRDISLLSEGEVRKLFVNFAGIPVKAGDHLAEIYSPSVYSAGQDLLVALKNQSKESELIQSATLKLSLLGVPKEYIQKIEKSRRVPETFTLKSPIAGYVESLSGSQGKWLKKGQLLCRIEQLDHLWLTLDAYESDLPWIKYGQKVRIDARALPGRSYEGMISYIPPRLDDQSRTAKIRVNVENKDGALKPGMFVSALLKAEVDAKGRVKAPIMEGKWISPMHPEIVKDGPGDCDVCGMQLVKAEELGLNAKHSNTLPLIIPGSAVLLTGKRAVVYVRLSGKEPVFEGRVIKVGPRVGNDYVVLSGLEENERVVIQGSFKIDSEMQILSKPSMMSYRGESNKILFNDDGLKVSMETYLKNYLTLSKQLAADETKQMNDLAKVLLKEIEKFDASNLNEAASQQWRKQASNLKEQTEHMMKAKDVKSFREAYKVVSKQTIALVEKTGHNLPTLHLMHCGMAKGSWLQDNDQLKNPYYGHLMLRCGDVKHRIPADPE